MKFDLENDFLPVGSIVSIRFSVEKFMIMGFCTIDANTQKMYDYCAVLYPFGLENLDKVIMFNRDVVKKIHHLGYSDDEEKEFRKKIQQFIKNKIMEKDNE